MEPTWKSGDVALYLGNSLDVLSSLEDGSIDVTLTDFPYGLDMPYENYDDTQEHLMDLIARLVPEIRRVSKLSIVFCGINNVQIYPVADWIGCWFYGTTGNFGKFGYNAWQPFLLYGPNNNRYGMDTIKYSKMEKKEEGHPCPKPVGLMTALIERFTSYGQIVLDPCMGIGATGIACVKTGRKFIGIDIGPKYIEKTMGRIIEAQSQMRLL